MANAMYLPRNPFFGGTMEYTDPAVRGKANVNHLSPITRQTISTDPIGTTTVTFQGVNAGSEIRVYLPDGTEVAGIESCAANQALTWPVYAGGSANNTVRVVVVNTAYKIKEFTYDVALGNQSLPIQQEADKWYSNPI
jgi:hypothetical protein